ncbi:HNH endonuclease signature motif containing protein [Brevibacterium otitidis]|uniref:HNH endonuclease signature motif containing protein n=1 Tax=Brevibacterium otitidis TaxID=53364 RepID=A0ABV5X353_9MICO|nr:HNH endonuclease signature motif containing protein [Brevibacterium otitidis]
MLAENSPPLTPRRNDTVVDTSDFADCLYRLTSANRDIDARRMAGLGFLFDAFLARATADTHEDVSVQVAAVRELAADPRALGRPDRDGTDFKNEAERRRDAYAWLVERTASTSLMHMADALDTTVTRVRSRVQTAAAGLIGLPAFTAQARAGVIGYDRYAYATGRAAAALEARHLADFDAGLVRIRVSDMTAFKRAVTQLISTIITREERAKQVRDRRTVETYYEPHGQGVLIARGPSHQIALLEARLAGMARSVIKGLGQPLGVSAGREIVDERGMGELMFDFLTSSQPAGTLITQSSDTDSTTDAGTTCIVDAANPAGIDIDATADKIAESLAETGVQCPVDAEWLKRQARITVTVPALALLNQKNDDEEEGGVRVPGMVNGHPISPDTARQLTGTGHSTVYRILTDPTDGTVLDHAAETYTIPERMRIALVEKWQFCTLPGCDRSAVKAELDHIEPFNHEDPGRGGPTSMGNLHPLCREHHQMKTEDKLRVRRDPDTGMLTWTLPGGHQLTALPPTNPVGQAHAQQLLNLTTA